MGAPSTIPPEHRIQCGFSRVGGAVGAERKVRTQFPDGGTQYYEGARARSRGARICPETRIHAHTPPG